MKTERIFCAWGTLCFILMTTALICRYFSHELEDKCVPLYDCTHERVGSDMTVLNCKQPPVKLAVRRLRALQIAVYQRMANHTNKCDLIDQPLPFNTHSTMEREAAIARALIYCPNGQCMFVTTQEQCFDIRCENLR